MRVLALSALAFALTAASNAAFDVPSPNAGAAAAGVYQARGNNGQGQGSQSGVRNGRKSGPQDGSGPIHTPGTGGGTGAGRRAGRR